MNLISQIEDGVALLLASHQQAVASNWQDLAQNLYVFDRKLRDWFGLNLPPFVIRFGRLHRSRYGHFLAGCNEFAIAGEIAINIRYVNLLPFWRIIGTLHHEQLHLWQRIHGKAGKGNYHNRQFQRKADESGLVVDSGGYTQYDPNGRFAAELAKRRGKRKPKHKKDCACGCQRHRGKAKRKARGSKERRKKGDKSKNGKEGTVVVMYTLKRGDDGKLHGPINKKLYATFAGRKPAAQGARAEATKRGFGPDTTKTVQIVLDGAKGLKHSLQPLFPKAIFTLDVCQVVENLWTLGHHFHKEGSEELKAWVEELKTLVYAGKSKTLVRRLETLLEQVPKHGPGTKGRRTALTQLIGYLKPRRSMMR